MLHRSTKGRETRSVGQCCGNRLTTIHSNRRQDDWLQYANGGRDCSPQLAQNERRRVERFAVQFKTSCRLSIYDYYELRC
ncbi:hypothetical protein TNCV_4815141 [Trichonephila clavipes]|nr:hypothetical protein TNCV_4815141 [Trichonephila clavipes]